MNYDNLTPLRPNHVTTADLQTLAEGVDALADTTDAAIRRVSEECALCDTILAREVEQLRDRFRRTVLGMAGALIASNLALGAHLLVEQVSR